MKNTSNKTEIEKEIKKLKKKVIKEKFLKTESKPLKSLKTESKPLKSLKSEKIQYYKRSANPISKNEKILLKECEYRRKKVQNPSKWPNSPKGLIQMKFGTIYAFASGDMIFPMVVLTAAHNVYNRETKKYADLEEILKFILGKNGDLTEFGVYGVLGYFFPDYYVYQENESEDYAVLFLVKG